MWRMWCGLIWFDLVWCDFICFRCRCLRGMLLLLHKHLGTVWSAYINPLLDLIWSYLIWFGLAYYYFTFCDWFLVYHQGGGGDKKDAEEDKKPKQSATGKALAERMARQREEEERIRKLEVTCLMMGCLWRVYHTHSKAYPIIPKSCHIISGNEVLCTYYGVTMNSTTKFDNGKSSCRKARGGLFNSYWHVYAVTTTYRMVSYRQ